MTVRPSFDGVYARCPAHSTLPREDALIPADPLTTIPRMSAALEREAAPPTNGTEA